MFAKLLALWIVLLAVSPFTAPFSACELDEVLATRRQERALPETLDVVASHVEDGTHDLTQLTVADTPGVGPVHPLQKSRLQAPSATVSHEAMVHSPGTCAQPATHVPATGPLARRSSTLRL
jgi:hypothetical protein